MSGQNASLRDSENRVVPPVTMSVVGTVLLAGIAAVTIWEIWARFITPMLIGGPLQTETLIQSVFHFNDFFIAEAIHLISGILLYPIGYLFIVRPIWKKVAPSLPWWFVGLGYGVVLWIFALYVMAHLVGGLPAFLNFIPLTWASLVGHMLFGFVTALVALLRRS
ncbi:hypothetical protein PUV47_01110 [Pseudovibrio exalbescens]|uniref:hypothetical protein n=1 Tax=Pseudovibrio exalbescens TaxID=197461 RepID=UPI002366FD6E|nr:hypothetical protein [Pseudovibrio exalbescens]MDD7908502.1 hypothetical protein [Pseudovibrio exalbescens]